MTHPERVEEMQPVCVWCDHVLACHHCGTEQPYDDVSVLKAALTASEQRAETARDDALEEAAKACEERRQERLNLVLLEDDSTEAAVLQSQAFVLRNAAQAIRAMKGQR